ncbi:DUF4142 domain-containing protein [Croceibacterium sp. TMG7-5b_MA50]|uniref:DUF4142 domain-containing protein n=1 Tax=Croceibacterium sp. TMG7-5b_MA50 TaxID=3121290 RepID=UPI00322201F9
MRPPIVALAALSLAACGSAEEPAASPTAATGMAETSPTTSNGTATDAESYATMAGASDLFEIQSSQLALEKSQNAGVREFAQMMIDHHRKTTEQVTTAAREAGMTPAAPQLTSMQRDNMTGLQAASGADFDRIYLEQQRQAHQMALALHQEYAQDGDTPQLQEVARTAVPIIQQHMEQAQALTAS